jgi:hypothetical protein
MIAERTVAGAACPSPGSRRRRWRPRSGTVGGWRTGCTGRSAHLPRGREPGAERTAARDLALLRKIALDLARGDTTLESGPKGRRKHAGRDDTFAAPPIAG